MEGYRLSYRDAVLDVYHQCESDFNISTADRIEVNSYAMNVMIWCVCLTIIGCWANEEKTGISIKAKFVFSKKNIALACRDWEELALGGNMFADKSLLIKEVLLDPSQVVVINYPRFWGKTMNLQMLDLFLRMNVEKYGLEIPPDNETSMSFRCFSYGRINAYMLPPETLKNPLLISKQKYVIPKYLGQNPVVYFTFGTMEECDVIYQLKTRIRNAFLPHEYLIGVYYSIVEDDGAWVTDRKIKKDKIGLFEEYIHGSPKFDLDQLANSLYLLSEMLHMHFGKRVYIIVEDYDKAFQGVQLFPHKNFTGNESQYMQTTFLQFFIRFMKATFSKNPHLEKGFLSGVLPLPKEVLEQGLGSVSECNYLNGKLSEYHGFNQWEVDALFKHLSIPKMIQDDVIRMYNGYRPNNKNLKVYNPWSIVNAANSLQMQPYWVKTINIDTFLKNFMKIETFKEKLELLINGKNATVSTAHKQLSVKDYDVLIRANKNVTNVAEHGNKFADIGLMYLYWNGYLTLSENFDWNSQKEFFLMRIPNAENEDYMKKKFYDLVEIPR